MSESEIDLGGDWVGIYNYPALYGPTQFQASLRDEGGRISGETIERDESITAGAMLRALVDGRHDGATLSFVKIYEDESFNHEMVHYHGRIDAGGDEVSGTWEVPGMAWSGTFIMVRGSGAQEAIERRIAETIESP